MTSEATQVPIRIYLVEDHEIMREMLQAFLGQEADLEVCGAAETGEAALEGLAAAEADLVVVDMALPGMSGIDLVEEARRRWPHLACLMYSAHGEASYVERALAAGAGGYVLKGDPDELPYAIRQVKRGEVYLSAALTPQSKGP